MGPWTTEQLLSLLVAAFCILPVQTWGRRAAGPQDSWPPPGTPWVRVPHTTGEERPRVSAPLVVGGPASAPRPLSSTSLSLLLAPGSRNFRPGFSSGQTEAGVVQ